MATFPSTADVTAVVNDTKSPIDRAEMEALLQRFSTFTIGNVDRQLDAILQSAAVTIDDYGADNTGAVASDAAFTAMINDLNYVRFGPGDYSFAQSHLVPGEALIFGVGSKGRTTTRIDAQAVRTNPSDDSVPWLQLEPKAYANNTDPGLGQLYQDWCRAGVFGMEINMADGGIYGIGHEIFIEDIKFRGGYTGQTIPDSDPLAWCISLRSSNESFINGVMGGYGGNLSQEPYQPGGRDYTLYACGIRIWSPDYTLAQTNDPNVGGYPGLTANGNIAVANLGERDVNYGDCMVQNIRFKCENAPNGLSGHRWYGVAFEHLSTKYSQNTGGTPNTIVGLINNMHFIGAQVQCPASFNGYNGTPATVPTNIYSVGVHFGKVARVHLDTIDVESNTVGFQVASNETNGLSSAATQYYSFTNCQCFNVIYIGAKTSNVDHTTIAADLLGAGNDFSHAARPIKSTDGVTTYDNLSQSVAAFDRNGGQNMSIDVPWLQTTGTYDRQAQIGIDSGNADVYTSGRDKMLPGSLWFTDPGLTKANGLFRTPDGTGTYSAGVTVNSDGSVVWNGALNTWVISGNDAIDFVRMMTYDSTTDYSGIIQLSFNPDYSSPLIATTDYTITNVIKPTDVGGPSFTINFTNPPPLEWDEIDPENDPNNLIGLVPTVVYVRDKTNFSGAKLFLTNAFRSQNRTDDKAGFYSSHPKFRNPEHGIVFDASSPNASAIYRTVGQDVPGLVNPRMEFGNGPNRNEESGRNGPLAYTLFKDCLSFFPYVTEPDDAFGSPYNNGNGRISSLFWADKRDVFRIDDPVNTLLTDKTWAGRGLYQRRYSNTDPAALGGDSKVHWEAVAPKDGHVRSKLFDNTVSAYEVVKHDLGRELVFTNDTGDVTVVIPDQVDPALAGFGEKTLFDYEDFGEDQLWRTDGPGGTATPYPAELAARFTVVFASGAADPVQYVLRLAPGPTAGPTSSTEIIGQQTVNGDSGAMEVTLYKVSEWNGDTNIKTVAFVKNFKPFEIMTSYQFPVNATDVTSVTAGVPTELVRANLDLSNNVPNFFAPSDLGAGNLYAQKFIGDERRTVQYEVVTTIAVNSNSAEVTLYAEKSVDGVIWTEIRGSRSTHTWTGIGDKKQFIVKGLSPILPNEYFNLRIECLSNSLLATMSEYNNTVTLI